MNEPESIDLFAEDRAHEEFLRAILTRRLQEEGQSFAIRVYSAEGGHGRAFQELRLYQKSIESNVRKVPAILIVAIDANCSRYALKRKEIEKSLVPMLKDRAVIACPDPHIERWFIADPPSFREAIGNQPKPGKKKCDRDRYKTILAKSVREAGHPSLLGGIEFAREIVDSMDLYRAGKADKSLKDFLDQLGQRLKSR